MSASCSPMGTLSAPRSSATVVESMRCSGPYTACSDGRDVGTRRRWGRLCWPRTSHTYGPRDGQHICDGVQGCEAVPYLIGLLASCPWLLQRATGHPEPEGVSCHALELATWGHRPPYPFDDVTKSCASLDPSPRDSDYTCEGQGNNYRTWSNGMKLRSRFKMQSTADGLPGV
jgi:hypothetical protein